MESDRVAFLLTDVVTDEILTGRGYAVIEDWFDPGPILSIIDGEMTKPGPLVAGGYRPDVIGHSSIQNLITNSDLLAIGERVLGQRPAFGSLGINVVPPGSSGMEPHMDYPYFAMAARPSSASPALCLQFIWYPVDVTLDMGATFVFEGSQMDPSLNSVQAHARYGRKAIEARAGSLFIGHGALWHGVLPNQSDRMRPVVLGSYVPYWCKPMTRVQIPSGISSELAILMCSDFRQRVGQDYDRITR